MINLYVILLSFFIFTFGANTSDKCEQSNMDVVFLVDSSSSIKENISPKSNLDNWALMKSFIKEVVKLLPIKQKQARVAIIPFSSVTNPSSELSDDYEATIAFIERLPHYGGNTNTSGALRFARNLLLSSAKMYPGSYQKVLVLITDGFANVDSALTLQEARINKQSGIIHYAVGVTSYANEDELQDLVSDPSSYHYLNASDFTHLNLLINELLQRLTCPQPPPPEPCRDTRADLVFILDSSGSILFSNADQKTQNLTNWITMKSFFMNVASNLNIGPQDTRISLIYFSQEAFILFYLNNYTNKEDIINAIEKLDIIGSQTNTSGALRLMNDDVFTPMRGDRPEIHNVAILMTDGQSNVDASLTIPEATRAKKLGVRMFVVGLTDQINSAELIGMSSKPIEQHYFNRTTYSLVNTIVSNLVWNVCHGTCADSETDCQDGNPTRCLTNEHLSWIMYSGKLIIGHDYARLNGIQTSDACKSVCLQDPQCRSIEFLPTYQECSVSYYRKDDAPQSFREDPEVDYYEWTCSS